MKKNLQIAILTILFVLEVLISIVFFKRLYLPYNEEGNYFDENIMVVYHQQSLLSLGTMLILVFLAISFLCFKLMRKSLPSKSK